MATKSVYGYVEGNKNRLCTLVGEYKEGKLWIIKTDFDIALELEGVLYRLGYVGEHGVIGCEDGRETYGTKVSDEKVKRYTDLASEGGILDKVKGICSEDYKKALRTRSQILMDESFKPDITFCNAHFFAMIGARPKYETIRSINEEVRVRKEELENKVIAAQYEEAEKVRKELRLKLLTDVKEDNYIDADDLLSLADDFEVTIPLRTRGWIINKLTEIKSNSLKWCPAKKSDRPSDKVFQVYREVRQKVLDSLV